MSVMPEWERVARELARTADRYDVGVAVHAEDGHCMWTTQVLDVHASSAAEAAMLAGARYTADPEHVPAGCSLRLQFVTLCGQQRQRVDLRDRLLTPVSSPWTDEDRAAWSEQPNA